MLTGWSHDPMSPTAMPLQASLHAPPGCLSLPRTTRRWQPQDGFEPQADVALRPSALHLAEKLFKKLLKFRKAVPFSGMIICRHVKDAPETTDMEKHPDSDEAGSVCSDTSSSSRISSSSFESLVIPPTTPQKAAVMAGSQMMASMLLSLLDDDGEDDDDTNAESEDDEKFLGGPRVSAWHQPQDEIVTVQEWRLLRFGTKPSAASTGSLQVVKNTDAADHVSNKYSTTSGNHHKLVPNTAHDVRPRVVLQSANRNT